MRFPHRLESGEDNELAGEGANSNLLLFVAGGTLLAILVLALKAKR